MKIYLLIALSFTQLVMAFGIDGGGGKAVVCRDAKEKIFSAELLDIYEGRVRYNVDSLLIEADPIVVAKYALEKITNGLQASKAEYLEWILSFVDTQKRILPDGSGLLEIPDSHHIVVPKNCAVEQLANFTVNSQILIDGEIWAELDDLNKGALLAHEAVYAWLRGFGATDSIRARKYVAYALAGMQTVAVREGIPKDAYFCQAIHSPQDSSMKTTQFWAYNDKAGELFLQFEALDGQAMITKTTVSVDTLTMTELDSQIVRYWLHLDSPLDQGTPVSLSVDQGESNGTLEIIKRIGFARRPNLPTTRFHCAR